MSATRDEDRRWLDRAALYGLTGAGAVEPGVTVGAAIVRAGSLLAMGRYRRFGGVHAERDALNRCRATGVDPAGATVYVTLEPCAHTGKQPPCVDALIDARVGEVVYARQDPNPLAAGGAGRLREAGIGARLSRVSRPAFELGAPFAHRVTTGLPWVTVKWAQSIDGRIATRGGESKWISNQVSRAWVHRRRGEVDAIVTGIGTARADDPMLTARLGRAPRRGARRVVIDPEAELSIESKLVRSVGEASVHVVCADGLAGEAADRVAKLEAAGVHVLPVGESDGGLDLRATLSRLYQDQGVSNVLVEAGPGLVGSLLRGGLVNEVAVFVAPMVFGDPDAMAPANVGPLAALGEASRFELVLTRAMGRGVQRGPDALLVYRSRGT